MSNQISLLLILSIALLTSCEGPVPLKYYVSNDSSGAVTVTSTGDYDSAGYTETITNTINLPANTKVKIAQGTVLMAMIKKQDRFHNGLDAIAISRDTVYAKINLLDRKYWQLTWDTGANYELKVNDAYFK